MSGRAARRLPLSEPGEAAVAVMHPSPAIRLGLAAILEQHGIHAMPVEPSPALRGITARVLLVDSRATGWQARAGAGDEPCVILAVVSSDDVSCCIEALRSGAHGVVSLTWEPEVIVLAVRAGLACLVVVPLPALNQSTRPVPVTQVASLTPSDRRLISALAEGRTISQLAVAIGYSERTVSRMVQSLCRKLGATNRLHAITTAASLGLLE